MSSVAAIFPGQGAQLVGMGKDVAEQFSVAREIFHRADAVLGFSLSSLCFEGPAERIEQTDIQQPAIFTTSVALWHAALATGTIREGQFSAMAGLSLGEYTALHLAGAMSFDDALRLVHRRGQLMQEAATKLPGGMVSIMGADEAKVDELCRSVAAAGRVAPANLNCPGQIVISGDKTACEAATAAVDTIGGKAIPLKVAGAFHSPLMQSAADALRGELAKANIQSPRVKVISNVNVQYHGDPPSIRELLVSQVVSPVRWQACCERLIADGFNEFFEVGPNKVLLGLMRKINRTAKVTNISSAAALAPAATA